MTMRERESPLKQSPLGGVSLAVACSFGPLGTLLAAHAYELRATVPPEDIGRIGLGMTSLFLVTPCFVTIGGAVIGALGLRVRGHRSTMAAWGCAVNLAAAAAMAPHGIWILTLILMRGRD